METKVPGYERSQERKFPETFVLRERKFPRIKGPGNDSSRELLFPENESSRERKVPRTKVPGNFVPGERKFSIGTFRSWERKGLGYEKSVIRSCNSVGMRPRTDRHTDTQTHTQTHVTTIHFALSTTHVKYNNTLEAGERRLTHHVSGAESESDGVRQGGLTGGRSRRLTSVNGSTANDACGLLVRPGSRSGPHVRHGDAVGRGTEAGRARHGGGGGRGGGLVESTQHGVVVEVVGGRR